MQVTNQTKDDEFRIKKKFILFFLFKIIFERENNIKILSSNFYFYDDAHAGAMKLTLKTLNCYTFFPGITPGHDGC